MAQAPLHTAVETPTYLAALRKVGLSQAERDFVLDQVMSDPAGGDIIKRSGGVRKVRVAKEDTGKSGGYRALAYFMDMESPVHLLYLIDKSDVDNLSDGQVKALKTIVKAIKDERNKSKGKG